MAGLSSAFLAMIILIIIIIIIIITAVGGGGGAAGAAAALPCHPSLLFLSPGDSLQLGNVGEFAHVCQ